MTVKDAVTLMKENAAAHARIKELEAHVKDLQEEVRKQENARKAAYFSGADLRFSW